MLFRSLSTGSTTIRVIDDLLLLSGQLSHVTLPASPSDGDVKTIRVLANSGANLHLGSENHYLYTDEIFNYVQINNQNQYRMGQNERFELVFWNNVWYVNKFGL